MNDVDERPINEYRGSAVDTFAHCRRKYRYEYIELIEAARTQKPLYFGTVMHKYLEALYSGCGHSGAFEVGGNLFDTTNLSDMDQVEVMEMVDLYENLAPNYREYWAEADKARETYATEFKFRVHLGGDDWFVGTIDHLFRDRDTGLFWLEDHKSVKSIAQYIKSIEYSRQTPRYLKATRLLASGRGEIMHGKKWTPVTQHFPHISGIIFNLISKTIPHPPKVLVKGKGLSIDKSQNTTLQLYREALIENGWGRWFVDEEGVTYFNADDKYREILELLASQETPLGNRYFRRIPLRTTPYQMDFAFSEMREIIYEIDLATETDRFYRNSGRHCGWCQYNAICSAEAAGENVEMILDTMYRPKADNPYAEDEEDDVHES
jgi:hypothetical protein